MRSTRAQYCDQLLEQTALLQDFTGDSAGFEASVRPVTLSWQPRRPTRAGRSFHEWWLPENLQTPLQLSLRSTPSSSRLRGHTDVWAASESFRHLGVAGSPGSGKTTLARLLARHHATQFLADPARLFPVLLDVNGAQADFSSDLDMALLDEGPILAIVDGIGRNENDWDLIKDQLADRELNRIRSVIFAESPRSTRVLGGETTWSYIDSVVGLSDAGVSESTASGSALIARLRRTARERGDVNGQDLNVVGSLLLELFLSIPAEKLTGPALALMRAIEDTALRVEISHPDGPLWLRELVDAVEATEDGKRLEANELQLVMPGGEVGRWLLELVPGTSRYRFSHSVIRDVLVLRALARRRNEEIASLLRQLPSGPTRARLASGIVDYLRTTGDSHEGQPRWRAMALTLGRDSDLMHIGPLVATSVGLRSELSEDAQAAVASLSTSLNGLETARTKACNAEPAPPRSMPVLAPRATANERTFVERTRRTLASTPDSVLLEAIERLVNERVLMPEVLDRALVTRLTNLPDIWARVFRVLDSRTLVTFLEKSIEAAAGLELVLAIDLTNCDAATRRCMAETLGLVLQPDALGVLEVLAGDSHWQVRRQVALSLGGRGSNVGDLLRLRSDPEPNVRLAVLTAALLTSEDWGQRVINDALLTDGSSTERAIICHSLKRLTPVQAEAVRQFFDDSDIELRLAAAVTLRDRERAFELMRERREVAGRRLMGPGFHMSYGHVLTERSDGDALATLGWQSMANLGALLDDPPPKPERVQALRSAGEAALGALTALPAALDWGAPEAKRLLGALRVLLTEHPDRARFAAQLVGVLSALEPRSYASLCDSWNAALARISSRDIAELVKSHPPANHPHLVAAVLLGRFGDRNVPSNVLRRHEYVLLRSVGSQASIDGILTAVEGGRLTTGQLARLAELLCDILSRSDTPLTAETSLRAERLLGFVRSPRPQPPENLEAEADPEFSFARKLLHARELLSSAHASDASEALDSIEDFLRNDEWWALQERCLFAEGKFGDVVKAHEERRGDTHWAVRLHDRALLGARAANLTGEPQTALRFLGVGSGRDHDIVRAQMLLIGGDQPADAKALARRWADRDPYATCLAFAADDGSSRSSEGVNVADWRDEELAQLSAEFASSAYAKVPGAQTLVTILNGELSIRRAGVEA